MADEQAFLDLLIANPHDRPTRLIYADWLEERGDPRALDLRQEVMPANKCSFCATEISSTFFLGSWGLEEMKCGLGGIFTASCPRCNANLIAYLKYYDEGGNALQFEEGERPDLAWHIHTK